MTVHFLSGLQWQCVDTGRLSFESSVSNVHHRPISSINSVAYLSHVPAVSIAIGTNMCVASSSRYFFHFIYAACIAALPASNAVDWRWEAAYVSGIVTSDARALPLDQGINVASYGRLPFCMMSPVGSLCIGILARLIALHMMSLIIEWRWWRGVDRLHDRPCRPLASTALPHAQV